MKTKKIIMIVGSLRKQSFNHQLARIAKEMIADQAEVSFLDYEELPFFNQDLESVDLEVINRIRKEIKEADGIWIFSPEYNHSVPGVLKNLLDWLSRGNPSAIWGQSVTFSGAGGSSGTASMQDHLLLLLNVMGMNVMTYPRASIALSMEEFMSNELSLSDYNRDVLQNQVKSFLQFIQ